MNLSLLLYIFSVVLAVLGLGRGIKGEWIPALILVLIALSAIGAAHFLAQRAKR